jgi:glucose/mannose-6-phosphate isomerase
VGSERSAASNEAKSLAVAIQGRVPVVWGAEGVGAVAATRWKTDLNENAEVPAFASALPELDHNEVVGWSAGAGDGFAVVALRHEDEHPDVAARFPVSEAIARDAGALVHEVAARGESPLGRLLTLVLLGGAVSVYLGILRGVDPGPIANIDRVKREQA